MLALAISCVRSESDEEPIRLVMRGELVQAVSLVKARLDCRPGCKTAGMQGVLGQVIGRALIGLGREEEAEELLKRQLRVYEADSRTCVRWMSSLDHGAMQLALNRLGRAAETFKTVADDEAAPAGMRIEALAGFAIGMRGLGEYRRAQCVLSYAEGIAERHSPRAMRRLLHALTLETAVMRNLRTFDEGADPRSQPSHTMTSGVDSLAVLQRKLLDVAGALEDVPIASQRLRYLALLIDGNLATTDVAGRVTSELRRMRHCKLWGYEKDWRLEAALAHGLHGDGKAAHDLLGGFAHDEATLHRHRYSLELKYCMSRVYTMQGRHMDALRIYKEHVAQTLFRLHSELAHLPHLRCIEKHEMAEHGDAAKMLLPLRYRRAYQYIIDHLDDRDLSVREVAMHIDVTERALQMAFRNHLGSTPAEVIRRRRLERIREDLRETTDRRSVLDIAQRWGMSNRSTLAQNYRQFFNETPTAALQGKAVRKTEPGSHELR